MVLGWAVAPAGKAPSSPTSGSSSSTPTKATRSAKSTSRFGSSASPEQALLRSIRDSPDEQSRILATLNLARTLPLSEAGKWLDQGLFSQREGFALTIFNKTLVDALAEGRPRRLCSLADWKRRDSR